MERNNFQSFEELRFCADCSRGPVRISGLGVFRLAVRVLSLSVATSPKKVCILDLRNRI